MFLEFKKIKYLLEHKFYISKYIFEKYVLKNIFWKVKLTVLENII